MATGARSRRASPVRGWIDLVLVDRSAPVLVATEIESAPRRFEQAIRWAGAKADALASATGFPFGLAESPTIHRLLVLRDTEANWTTAALFGALLKAAYPADAWQAMAALRGDAAWPGSVLLWARDRSGSAVELLPASPRRRP